MLRVHAKSIMGFTKSLVRVDGTLAARVCVTRCDTGDSNLGDLSILTIFLA